MDEGQASSNIAFQAYLTEHDLQPLDVAIQSYVRYITVWKIVKDHPINAVSAMRVRAGLYKMTGVRYLGSIKTSQPENEPSS